jgi:hypothetical protein
MIEVCLVAYGIALTAVAGAAAGAPERRALDYLAVEVPRWAVENRCYSCHNNGDAARALYEARKRGEPIPAEAVADTTRWLARPEGWDKNGGDSPFNDRQLARIQFASALASAVDAQALPDTEPLARAAKRLAEDQSPDGSWPVLEGAGTLGAPASYGRPLATFVAAETLRAADPERYRDAISRAEDWLLGRPLGSILDAAIVLSVTARRNEPQANAVRSRALEHLRTAQTSDGGWGPYPRTPPEPFDTALALLSLARLEPTEEVRAIIRRGRSYLIGEQLEQGGWLGTTRPAGTESYAEHLSTTGWATRALLATRDRER